MAGHDDGNTDPEETEGSAPDATGFGFDDSLADGLGGDGMGIDLVSDPSESTVEPSEVEEFWPDLPAPFASQGAGVGYQSNDPVTAPEGAQPPPPPPGPIPPPLLANGHTSEAMRNATTLDSEIDVSGTSAGGQSAGMPPEVGLDRYGFIDLIARGGQGEVWEMYDSTLKRKLAVKILRNGASARAREQLAEEIELTVSLSHPGIIPVFDRGVAEDGRPWFAMKKVEGRHLGKEISEVFAGRDTWSLRRLIDLLSRICEAVAYAHEQRVLHRDIKPRNVMVGRFGEVMVMDWGLARRLPAKNTRRRSSKPRKPRKPAGTAGYIPPECYADPRILDTRVDVFGLGAVLFTMLCGRRPPTTPDVVPRRADFPARWADGRDLPGELVELCLKATTADPARRLRSAGDFGRSLVDWLDGARKRDEALELVDRARALVATMDGLRIQVADLELQARQKLEGIPPWSSAEAKLAGWALEDRARGIKDDLVRREIAFEQTLSASLTRVPELPEALSLLSDHYRSRLIAAEARRDHEAANRAEALLRAYDRGLYAEWLAGHGRLSLLTDPPDATVTLHPFVERGRRLVVDEGIPLGTTPIVDVVVPRGSYLLTIESPGRITTRYPVFIERSTVWGGLPPGETVPTMVYLPKTEEVGPDDVYVPAGWAVFGGDETASAALPRCRLWVDGFVIRRFSVTWSEWLAFLRDMDARGQHEIVARCVPRHGDGTQFVRRRSDGQLDIAITNYETKIELGAAVAYIDYPSACEYAKWEAERTGDPWRLPHDLEWEKAARGVDGRFLPWGDFFEPSWTRIFDSSAGPPSAPLVGAAPEDVSPYGVRDVTGTVRNWCASNFRPGPPPSRRVVLHEPVGMSRAVRGGTWASKVQFCRPAGRFASQVDQRFRAIGMRLARSLTAPNRER